MVLHVIGFRCTMMPEPLSRHLCMHGLSTKFGKIPEICKQYPQNITTQLKMPRAMALLQCIRPMRNACACARACIILSNKPT